MTLREKMEEHIKYLCLLFQIEWKNSVPLISSKSLLYIRSISTPPIHGQTQYFTALHEIAHLLLEHGDDEWGNRVEHEAEAWAWAFQEGIIDPNPGVRWDVLKLVRDYAAVAPLRGWPDPGPEYDKLVSRLAA